MAPARRWLFRLIALVVMPLVCLGGLEAALRLGGYGYSTAFFKAVRVDGKRVFINNEDFSQRFFPPQLARWPAPIMMEARKPAHTYRIFILGGSAAMGDPEPAFGAGRYLEALLNGRYPREHFEVINVAITAINSNVVLPIARACARQHGDFWIIYMGNNEMVGPFGTATVFGGRAVPWQLVRLNLALQKTRVGQLMMALARHLKGNKERASWGGMQMFLNHRVAPDDPRKDVVYRNFRRNLRDILETGLDSGARILLSTVAVNLKDCPPLASLPGRRLSASDLAAFDRFYTNGCVAASRQDFRLAAGWFGQAAGLEPGNADVQYRWGKCLLNLTNIAAAREHLQSACDDDALPFRADSRINDLIRQAGRKFAGSRLRWFDAAEALERGTPDRICGAEWFYEHVHFNFDGNYRLARAWAGQISQLLPATITHHGASEWETQAACERRLGLTDWNRLFVFQSVLKRFHQPPLDTQRNNGARVEALRRQASELRRQMDEAGAARAQAVYAAALKATPDDHYLHEGYGEFLQATGNLPGAAAQWRRVHALLPYDYLTYYQLGRVFALQGKWAEAQASLQRVVAMHPYFAEAWFELGNVYFGEADYDQALREYERARQLQPHNPEVYCQLGKVYSLLKRSPESVTNFNQAIRLNPDYWQAHYALGGELGTHGRVAEAEREFAMVVRLQPEFPMGHLNLGVAFLKLGKPGQAREEFEETLRLEPGNRLAQDYLEHTHPQETPPGGKYRTNMR